MRLTTFLLLTAALLLPAQIVTSHQAFARDDVLSSPADIAAAKKAEILALRQAREVAKLARASTDKSDRPVDPNQVIVPVGGGHGGIVGGGVGGRDSTPAIKIDLSKDLVGKRVDPGQGAPIGEAPLLLH